LDEGGMPYWEKKKCNINKIAKGNTKKKKSIREGKRKVKR